MNTDTRKTLLNLITEYGQSLARVDGEKDLMKAIEARAVTECGVTNKAFKTVATAHHKDQVSIILDDLNRQVDLMTEIRDFPDYAKMFRDTTVSVELGVV